LKIKSIEKFVNYGVGSIALSGLRTMIFVFGFLTLIGLIPGIVVGGRVLIVSMVFVLTTVIYIIVVFALRNKDETFEVVFLLNGIFAVFCSAFFLLFPIQLIVGQDVDILFACSLFVVYIITVLVYFAITAYMIRYDKYKANGKAKRNSVAAFASLGAGAGVLVARMFLSSASQQAAINIAISCFLIVACLSSFGLVNFLKYHYVRKYSIESTGYYTAPKKPIRKKGDRIKKVAKIFRVILISLVAFTFFLIVTYYVCLFLISL
jgi:hypothetical protein